MLPIETEYSAVSTTRTPGNKRMRTPSRLSLRVLSNPFSIQVIFCRASKAFAASPRINRAVPTSRGTTMVCAPANFQARRVLAGIACSRRVLFRGNTIFACSARRIAGSRSVSHSRSAAAEALCGKGRMPLQTVVNAAQEPTAAGNTTHQILHEIALAHHLEAKRYKHVALDQNRSQVARTHEFHKILGIAGFELSSSSNKALACAIYSNDRSVHSLKSLRQHARLEKAHERANHIDLDNNNALQGAQI